MRKTKNKQKNYNKILIELYNFILFKYPLKWPIPILARKAGIKDINISFVHLNTWPVYNHPQKYLIHYFLVMDVI